MPTVQPAPSSVGDDDIATWMAQRARDVQTLGGQAEAAGRNLWAQATQAGQNLSAPNPSDILALGARFLSGSAPANDIANPNNPAANQFSPSQDVPSLSSLRGQQAQFGQVRNQQDLQNSWMAWPTLLPAGVGLAAAAAPAFGAGAAGSAVDYAATIFPDLESWQGQLEEQLEEQLGRPLNTNEKGALRNLARNRWEQVNGVRASNLGAQVHHDDPLEWAHLNSDNDPNRLSNLVGISEDGHYVANRLWRQFSRSLGGRTPTLAEIMAQKLKVGQAIEPFAIRPGLPRPPPNPAKIPPSYP